MLALAPVTATPSGSGTAMLLCFLLSGRFPEEEEEEERAKSSGAGKRRGAALGTTRAPVTWWEEVAAAAGMLRFLWSELLAKRPIMDLAFGIKSLMRQRGNLHVASVYIGSNSVQLKGREIRAELVHLLRILNLCVFFSKKPFQVFLKSAGYSQEDVLLRVSKAGVHFEARFHNFMR